MAAESEVVQVDDILKKFGFFNRYQIRMTLLLGFAFFANGMHCVNYIFVAESVNYSTDFYYVPKGEYENMGFPPGVAEELVIKVLRKCDPNNYKSVTNHEDNDIMCSTVAPEVEVVAEEDKIEEFAENIVTQDTEPVTKQDNNSTETTTKSEPDHQEVPYTPPVIPTQKNSETYNGAEREKYLWSQSILDLDVIVLLPAHVKSSKDLVVTINSTDISVACRNSDVIIKDTLPYKIKAIDSFWSISDDKRLLIHLEKTQERWWDRFLSKEEPIDLSKIDCSRPFDDLPEDHRNKVRELQWNQEQKMERLAHKCKINKCESGAFDAPWYNLASPSQYRNCTMFASTNDSDTCSASGFGRLTVPCEHWLYEHDDTFVSEFQLACQDWKRTLVGTVHSLGLMLGLFFQGQLSDKIGRKAAIIIAGLAAAVFGVAKSFANTYTVFILLELLEATLGDNCSPAFIMSVELVHKDRRLELQILFSIMFAMGGITMSCVAYFLPYWRHFVIAIYAPSVLFLLYYFVMDESVRWLLSKGKKKKAIEILQKMAKSHKTKLEENCFNYLQCEQKNAHDTPLRDTFRSKIVFRRFLVCLVWWISCTFIAFGLMVNVVSLAGSKYINFGLMSVADVPASFTMVYTLKKFKRKKPLLTSFFVAGFLCLVQSFVPKEHLWLSTGLYLMGKFVTTFTFATVYMYTSELFPTYTRNSMHALCSAIGRIGSIIAPMTPLLIQYMESLPTLLIGAISLIAGITTLFMPDLADEPLPDNVKQAEQIGLKVSMNRDSKIVTDLGHENDLRN